MPEYISREAAIKEMSHMMSECFPEAVEELDAVITTVKVIPAADVVVVVRCGECIRWTGQPDREYGHCSRFGVICLNSDYCSRGVRKAGRENGI